MDRHVSVNAFKQEIKWILQTRYVGIPSIFLGVINVSVKDQTPSHNLLMIVRKPTNLFPITKSSVPTIGTQSTITCMTKFSA